MYAFHRLCRTLCCLLSCWGCGSTASAQEPGSVETWIRREAVPLDDSPMHLETVARSLAQSRVIALGEATHGQHEVFDIKRQLTRYFIRHQGVRLVAYEASASQMRKASAYVSGQTDDWKEAMRGFGMLIWQVEENRGLLEDLRAWNQQANERDQVHLIGCDAQDSDAAMKRLLELLGDDHPQMALAIREFVPRAKSGHNQRMAGNRDAWDAILRDLIEWKSQLDSLVLVDKINEAEFRLRTQELYFALTMYQSRGGRDHAMAELLLQQLHAVSEAGRCVLWAHNAHIQRSPLTYLGSEDLAMGGHLAKKLGPGYYALGFAFGEGEFQANVQNANGTWGFRRYHLSPAPKGSLEATLQVASHPRFFLDFRAAPREDVVQNWLHTGHGHRWFGGYDVSDDCDALTRDASTLLQSTPHADFDGIVFVAKTQAANPLDPQRIVPVTTK